MAFPTMIGTNGAQSEPLNDLKTQNTRTNPRVHSQKWQTFHQNMVRQHFPRVQKLFPKRLPTHHRKERQMHFSRFQNILHGLLCQRYRTNHFRNTIVMQTQTRQQNYRKNLSCKSTRRIQPKSSELDHQVRRMQVQNKFQHQSRWNDYKLHQNT